jgi:hypothetical protein
MRQKGDTTIAEISISILFREGLAGGASTEQNWTAPVIANERSQPV